jgi:hypothetical protein
MYSYGAGHDLEARAGLAAVPRAGDMRPFTCDPRRAEDGGVTASRTQWHPIRKKVSGHDDGR